MQKRTAGILGIVSASLIWGTIPLILREVDGSPLIKTFYRVFFAFLTLSLISLATGSWRKLRKTDSKSIRLILAQGALLGFNWMLFLSAFEMTNVATVELLGYMGPVFVALIAPLFFKSNFDKRIAIPLVLSLAGMVIILAPHGLGVGSQTREILGAGLAACSAVTYAALMILGKRLTTLADTATIVWFESLGATLFMLPFAIFAYSTGGAPTGGIQPYFYLLLLGSVHTALASYLFFIGLKHLPAEQTAVFTYAEPVSAVIFAALFLAEPLTWYTVLGGALVVIGGTIVARFDVSEGIEVTSIEV